MNSITRPVWLALQAALPWRTTCSSWLDQYARVEGLDGVYAAGDTTSFPIKQGGIATQQAGAVAREIAARAGAPVKREPFRPVLRGLTLTGEGRTIHAVKVAGGHGDTSEFGPHVLWWPETKGRRPARLPLPVQEDRADLPKTPLPPDAIPVEVDLTEASADG